MLINVDGVPGYVHDLLRIWCVRDFPETEILMILLEASFKIKILKLQHIDFASGFLYKKDFLKEDP